MNNHDRNITTIEAFAHRFLASWDKAQCLELIVNALWLNGARFRKFVLMFPQLRQALRPNGNCTFVSPRFRREVLQHPYKGADWDQTPSTPPPPPPGGLT